MNTKFQYIEKIKKLIKYLLFFFINLLIIRYIPKYKLPDHEIIIIAMLIHIFYMIIDYKTPNIKLIFN